MKTLRSLAILFLALALAGFAQKRNALTVTFHVETNSRDTASFAIPVELKNLHRQAFIEKMPSITEREILGIYPFMAADGTQGCSFQLDNHGIIWLDTLSVEHRGLALVAMVNGRIVCDLLIDKRVSDGVITIPSGLTPDDMRILQKKIHLITPGSKSSPASQN